MDNEPTIITEQICRRAEQGDPVAVESLRVFVSRLAAKMPSPVLLDVARLLIAARQRELANGQEGV
jgi:hypothetical protein